MLANQMGMIASGYAAYALTGSATALGLVSSSMSLPMLLLALVGGVVADRSSRRTVILASQSTMCLSSALLAALAFAGALDVWHLVVFGFMQGAGFSFNMPARQAYVADLVGVQLLRSAISLQNAGMNFNRIAGPALAGVLLAFPVFGIGGTFLVITLMYVLAITTILRLPGGRPSLADPGLGRSTGWAHLLEGLRYVRSSERIVLILAVGSLALLFSMPYQSLLPLFAEGVFGMGAKGLGLLSAAAGVGALLGSLAVAASSRIGALGRLQLAAGVGLGLSLVGYGLAPSFTVAVGFVAGVGFTSAGFMALSNTLVMANTEPGFYGRVMSVYLLTFALMPITMIPAGWLADQIGGPITVAATGVIVVGVLAAASLHPPYRQLR